MAKKMNKSDVKKALDAEIESVPGKIDGGDSEFVFEIGDMFELLRNSKLCHILPAVDNGKTGGNRGYHDLLNRREFRSIIVVGDGNALTQYPITIRPSGEEDYLLLGDSLPADLEPIGLVAGEFALGTQRIPLEGHEIEIPVAPPSTPARDASTPKEQRDKQYAASGLAMTGKADSVTPTHSNNVRPNPHFFTRGIDREGYLHIESLPYREDQAVDFALVRLKYQGEEGWTETATPVILECEARDLKGKVLLPKDAAETKAKIWIQPIADPRMQPRYVSRLLADEEFAAMPLHSTGEGYNFRIDQRGRKELENPQTTLFLRWAKKGGA